MAQLADQVSAHCDWVNSRAQLMPVVDGSPVQARNVLFITHIDVSARVDHCRDLCRQDKGQKRWVTIDAVSHVSP